MADVNANIGVNIDTSAALAQLKSLQRQISQFHTSIAKSSESAAIAQKSLQKNLLNSVNAIGAFSAELRTVRTSAESFTASLEGNKFSMREYFRYAGASTKTFGRLFKSEFDTIGKVAEERVKRLQTQYIKLGRDTNGAMQALAITPTSLNMNDYATKTAMAAQKQALFNQLMKQGSTNLLNFGKNTQWAGRQLMVGFTIPLSIVGSAATKTFMEMEAQALKFKKVYGDLFTPQEETQAALDNIAELGKQFTKYGIAVSQTVGLAAEAAAAGFQGLDLQRQTTEATRLSVLGQIDSQQALETTIALQNAFGMSSENLAGSIDFLNAVENQTVVSLDDITTAIPKVAPVIQQLGGDVKDLTFFIAAMKEGGINASEGANALKSGLAALINPTGKASAMLKSFGINANEIVTKNKGNLKATVIEFAQALNQLDPLNRAQAIEQMFGKFQFARLSTLFANVAKDGNQAARVLDLANSSVEQLSALSEKELGMTADSAMNKFKKTVEDLKVALIPVGKAFLEAVTPILEFVGNILEKFGNLSNGTKKVVTLITLGIAGLGPIFLMTFGLLANLLANAVKGAMILRNGYLRLTGQSQILGEQTQYLTMEQIEAAAAAHSLDQSHARLTQQFTAEASAVTKLIAAYQQATAAGNKFMLNNPGMMLPRKGFASGVVSVPGSGNKDTVPAMLTPGEAVIPAAMAKKYAPLISGMIAGNIPGYKNGKDRIGSGQSGRIGKSLSTVLIPYGKNVSATGGAVNFTDIDPGNMADIASIYTKEIANQAKVSVNQINKEILAWKNANLTAIQNATNLVNEGISAESAFGPLISQFENDMKSLGGSTQKFVTTAKEMMPKLQKDLIEAQQKTKELGLNLKNASDATKLSTSIPGNIVARDMSQQGAYSIRAKSRQASTAILGGTAGIARHGIPGFMIPQGTEPSSRAYKLSTSQEHFSTTAMQEQNRITQSMLRDQSKQNVGVAINAAKKEAMVASPSKKTIKIGEDIARGLEVGMENRQDDVARAGSSLSTAAVGGTQKQRRVASRPQGAPSLPMSSVAANMPMSPQIQQAVVAQARVTQTATQRMQKLDRSLMGASFAISSLAGIASMSGGTLGEMSGTISKVTGALFALQAVTGLLTQTSLLSLAKKRLELAGFIGTNKVTGLFSGGIKSLLPNLMRFGGMIAKFLGPIGIAIGVITAGVSIIKMVNAARERERIAIEGLGDAALLSSDKIKTLADFFGIVATKSPLEQAKPLTIVSSAERSKVDQLRGSETFQKDFGKDISALKGATDKQAELVLKSISVQLKGKGFQQEQIQNIITALKDEAGKTEVKIDFKALDLSTDAGVAAVTSDVNTLLNSYGKAFENGYSSKVNNAISYATGETISWTTETISKGLQKNVNTASKSIGGLMIGISGQFANGTINAEKFNQSFDGISNKIANMPKADALFLMQNVLKNLPSELAQSAAGIKNVSDQLLVAKAAALGVATITPAMIKQLKAASKLGADPRAGLAAGRVRARISKDMKLIEDVVTQVVKSSNAQFKNLGEGITKDGPLRIAQDYIALQEQLIDMQNAPKLKKYNDELERQEGLLKGINKNIDAITEAQIAPLEAKLKTNGYLIDEIANKEDAINEKYNLQIEALSQVQKINDEIASSEKERLSLADALSSGDISAAAVIAQEARARAAASAAGKSESILIASRDNEIKALGRNDLEKQNKQIQLDIARIQRDQLDPLNNQKIAIEKNITAQNDLKSALEKSIDIRKSEIKYMGLTKIQIDEAVKALDLAQNDNINIKNPNFLPNIIKGAMGDADALKKSLDEVKKSASTAFGTPLANTIKTVANSQQAKQTTISATQLALNQGLYDPTKLLTRSSGGMVPKYFANGGFSIGTDTVPAMLTPGEFVMSKSSVDKYGPILSAMNNPSFKMPKSSSYSAGSSGINSIVDNSSAMYNYNIGITVPQSNASSNDIANAVIGQIKYIDAQRIRGQK